MLFLKEKATTPNKAMLGFNIIKEAENPIGMLDSSPTYSFT